VSYLQTRLVLLVVEICIQGLHTLQLSPMEPLHVYNDKEKIVTTQLQVLHVAQ